MPDFSADAVIEFGLTANSVLKRERSRVVVASAIKRLVVSETFTVDASFLVGNRASATFDADAVIYADVIGSFSARAVIDDGIERALVIKFEEVDITNDVYIETATFTQSVNGRPGSFVIEVKDIAHAYEFISGGRVTFDVAGLRQFDGYVTRATTRYAFPVDKVNNPTLTPRIWRLEGPDLNILFSKRFIYDQTNPARRMPTYPAETSDLDAITDIIANFLDLTDDDLVFDGVTEVGSPNPDEPGYIENIGASWGQAMHAVSQLTGAVWGLTPERVLFYEDANEADAPFGLSDQPSHLISTGILVWQAFAIEEWQPDTFYDLDPPFGVPIVLDPGTTDIWIALASGTSGSIEPDWGGGEPVADNDLFWYGPFPITEFVSTWAPGNFYGIDNLVVATDTDGIHYFVGVSGDEGVVGSVEPDWPTSGTVEEETSLYGFGDQNTVGYSNFTWLEDATRMVNDAQVWGAGTGSSTGHPTYARTEDEDSISNHGRWQLPGQFRSDLYKQVSVQKAADSLVYGSPQNLHGAKDPFIAVGCRIKAHGLRAGMKVQFYSQIFGHVIVLPIRRLTVKFINRYDVFYDLELSQEIDEPWYFAEFAPYHLPAPPPEIGIEIGRPPTETDPCPPLNYPYTPPAVTDYYPVFTDDFERASETQPVGQNGRWVHVGGAGADEPPVIVNGGWDPSGHATGIGILLDSPIGGSFSILGSVDTSAWGGDAEEGVSFGHRVQVFSGSVSGGFGFEDNTFLARCSNGNPGFSEVFPISPPIGGITNFRFAYIQDNYAALKIWLAGTPEPPIWTVRTAGTAEANSGYQVIIPSITYDSAAADDTRLMDVTVLADQTSASVAQPVKVADSVDLGSGSDLDLFTDGNGWHKTWPFSDPMDGYAYAVSWGSDLEDNVNSIAPSHSVGLAWGVFDPGPGAPQYADQQTSSFDLGRVNGLGVPFDNSSAHEPLTVQIKGKLWAFIGRSRGIDDRPSFETEHDVLVYINVIPWANGGSEPLWIASPYWRGLGRVAWVGSFHLTTEADAISQDFSFVVDYSEFTHPFGAGDNFNIEWSVVIDQPLALLQEMDPGGAPLLLPNTGHVDLWTSDVELAATWPSLGYTTHYCTPSTPPPLSVVSGGYGCESPVLILSDDTYQFSHGYIPGTLDVYIGNRIVRPGIEYEETDPQFGIITFADPPPTLVYGCYRAIGTPRIRIGGQ